VLAHCQFINGPEVFQLEAVLAAFSGAGHVVSCASGTDALLMVLMAKDVGRGDAVFCPSFTFCATGEAVALTGAVPVFVDVDEATFNMDAASLERGIAAARKLGLKPKAVIPVDLFGQSADHDAIAAVAAEEGLFVLDDAAQAFGASYKGRRLGTSGLATATSFFPAKPLGCFGDGGAIFTDDAELAATLRSIRVHGQGSDKYDNVRLGLTGRLDTMQAAILLEKLKIFEDEIAARNKVAERYAQGLGNVVTVPHLASGCTSVWAQYTIRLPKGCDRDGFAAALKSQGIPTAIYYPKSMHQQTAYRYFPVADGGLPVSESLSGDVISLPMHAYLDEPTQDRIIKTVRGAFST
jgi:dTDP-4-amino-4,6-dideoxygalactose transaminase